jgi:hypothetical protein
MRSYRFRTPLAAVACAGVLFLAGCSGNNPVNPNGFTQTDADDIAAQAGVAAAAGVVTNMGAAGGASGGVSGSAAARFTPLRAGSFAQAETTFTVGAITYTLGVTFYDAGGNALSGYGPLAHRMLVTTRATGAVASQQFNASVGHAGSLDVSGLEASLDTLVMNGACSDSVDASFTSLDQTRTRYFTWRSGAVLTDAALLKNRQTNPYPLSGTLSYVVHAVRYRSNQFAEVEKTWDATVVIVFDGTATPELTVNGAFHYRLNLVTGAVVRAVA